MTSRNRLNWLVAVSAMAAAFAMIALAPAAGVAAPAANGYRMAKFKVEIKGWQTMVQQNHHLAADECDVDNFSSGSETLSFATPKPVVITAMTSPGFKNPEFFAGKRLALPVKARVKRSYTPRVGKTSGDCGDNGGGVEGEPLPPDCGTKKISKWGMDLEFADEGHNRLELVPDWLDDPFERCTGAGVMSFPFLLELQKGGKPVTARLSERNLFDPRFGKWISMADAKYRLREGDWWAETQLHWEVSFTRLKSRR